MGHAYHRIPEDPKGREHPGQQDRTRMVGWRLGTELCGQGRGISDPVKGPGLQTSPPLLPSQWTAGNSITPSPQAQPPAPELITN